MIYIAKVKCIDQKLRMLNYSFAFLERAKRVDKGCFYYEPLNLLNLKKALLPEPINITRLLYLETTNNNNRTVTVLNVLSTEKLLF